MAYEASRKRARRMRLAEIEAQLPVLEQTYRASQSQADLNHVLKLKYEYNSILGDQVNNLLLKLRQKHFELGDKPDKLLARQLRGVQASRAIYQIKSSTGNLLTNPKDINNRFREFYVGLYTSRCHAPDSEIESFLDSIDMPVLCEEEREALDADFTLQEISDAIKSFPSGKATGPDGFGAEFYKAYSDVLAPILLRMINHSVENNVFPDSLYEANICLLLKKGRNETDPSGYRPLSLLNFDQKTVAKVLAKRLSHHVGSLIHSDQTGFLPGRYSFSNVRRLLNVLYSKHSKDAAPAVISLDAEKAFDQMEWKYMLTVLQRFGFGDRFRSLIKMLYAHPRSAILTNYDKSDPFLLHRGTRQGCCASPLLFNLALEPLAISIRNHPNIGGVRIGNYESRISLYADDVVLYLADPASSIPCLLDLIKQFGSFSGYTINWEKSVLMPISGNLDSNLLNSLPFKIVYDHFTYLGVVIPRNPKLLFKLNFGQMITNL